jgi:acetyl/propionyl-CoA carboxylase alpha subunit
MERALDEYLITGITTNLSFHSKLLEHPEFLKGNISTHFIEEHYVKPDDLSDDHQLAIAVAAVLDDYGNKNKALSFKKGNSKSANNNWKLSGRSGQSRMA